MATWDDPLKCRPRPHHPALDLKSDSIQCLNKWVQATGTWEKTVCPKKCKPIVCIIYAYILWILIWLFECAVDARSKHGKNQRCGYSGFWGFAKLEVASLSIGLSIYPFIHLSIHPSIYPSVHVSFTPDNYTSVSTPSHIDTSLSRIGLLPVIHTVFIIVIAGSYCRFFCLWKL